MGRGRSVFTGYLVAVLSLTLGCAAVFAAQGQPDRYIVKYRAGAEERVVSALVSQRGRVHRRLADLRLLSVSLPAPALAALQSRSDIELLEVDPKRFTQVQLTPYGIGMVGAEMPDGLAASSTPPMICIMDSGYDVTHEDLPSDQALVRGDDGYATGCGGAGCDTGLWNEDGLGHGTHVSGTIVALNDGKGVVGASAGGAQRIHMVKVFDNLGNWAYGSDLIAAIEQCRAVIEEGEAMVISMSLGGTLSSDSEEAAFDAAYASGVLSIAAAGNGGSPSLSYPASYESVMSVAAIDIDRQVALFSQHNSQVEIAAPGVAVLSTLPGDSYAYWDGTSMATPHVSAVAALVWSHHPGCSNDQLRTALLAGAEDLGGPGRDSSYGHGLVNALASESLLAGCSVTPPIGLVATGIANGQTYAIGEAEYGDEFQFTLEVPAGATDLRVIMEGASGDADVYVSFGEAPAPDSWECRPYINGNSETCVVPNPNPGTWHIMVRAFTAFTGVNLTGQFVEPDSSMVPVYFHPQSEVTSHGTVVGSYADLAYNDGILQTVKEVESGGKPSRRTSIAEHRWHLPGVIGGASVTLRLVAAGDDRGEGDNFIFEISSDGENWNDLLMLPLGGALKTYSIALPQDTAGDIFIRATDKDRTPRNKALEKLYVDQLEIVTIADGDESAPVAPTIGAATAMDSGVQVGWADNSDNEMGFQIRRAEKISGSCGDWSQAGQVATNVKVWLDETVMPSTTYCYQVVAFTATQESASGIAEATTGAAPEPDMTLSAEATKNKGKITVTLSWDDQQAAVTVYRRINGGADKAIGETESDTYVDPTGLKGSPVLDYWVCTASTCSNTVTVTF